MNRTIDGHQLGVKGQVEIKSHGHKRVWEKPDMEVD